MSSDPKKHHYVPECYLKSFSNNQKQFWKRSKDNKKCSICTPGQVAYELDTNRIRSNEILSSYGISDDNLIEKHAFTKQENNFPKILSKIRKYSDGPIVVDKQAYILLLETLVTIKRRNPQTRSEIIQAFIDGYNSTDAVTQFKAYLVQEAKINGESLPEDLDSYLENYVKSRATNPNWVHDMYLLGYLKSDEYDIIEKMTNQLYALKQFILHAPVGVQFVTSDNPGFTKTMDAVVNAGKMGQPFEYYFPLTPTICLHINSNIRENNVLIEKTIHPKFISKSQVAEINQMTKFISNNKLFAYDKSVLESL